MSDEREATLLKTVVDWDRAMVGNDAVEISRYMTEDWTIIGPDGSVNGRARFLALVSTGQLTHDVMETHDPHIRIYGDTAVVIARGVSGGEFRGQPFRLLERMSCVFVRSGGEWVCVSTHLSALAPAAGADPVF